MTDPLPPVRVKSEVRPNRAGRTSTVAHMLNHHVPLACYLQKRTTKLPTGRYTLLSSPASVAFSTEIYLIFVLGWLSEQRDTYCTNRSVYLGLY